MRFRYTQFCLLLAVLGAVAFISAPLDGQTTTVDSIHHRNNCRLARQVLLHGQPAPKRPWALGYFVTCRSDAVEIVSQTLRQHRTATTFAREFDEVISAASSLSDREIAFASLRVATDNTAGLAARLQALRLLYAQVVPGAQLDYTRLLRLSTSADSASVPGATRERYEPLEQDWVVDRAIYAGEPFRPGDLDLIGRDLAAIASSTRESITVRAAASAVAGAYRAAATCPRGTSPRACRARLQEAQQQRTRG